MFTEFAELYLSPTKRQYV